MRLDVFFFHENAFFAAFDTRRPNLYLFFFADNPFGTQRMPSCGGGWTTTAGRGWPRSTPQIDIHGGGGTECNTQSAQCSVRARMVEIKMVLPFCEL